MMDEGNMAEHIVGKMELLARRRAREKAQSAKWDIDVAAFYFAVLILVIILLYQGARVEIVAVSAIAGLVFGWLIGWIKGKHKYHLFYDEELLKMELELGNLANRIGNVTPDEQTLKKRQKKKSRRKNAGDNVS